MTTKNSKEMMATGLSVAVIITAAGSSTRIGGQIKKEYLPLKNGTVISSSAKTFLKTFLQFPKITLTDFVVTCPINGIQICREVLFADEELNQLKEEFVQNKNTNFCIVEGSTTRQSSVFNGLKTVFENKKNPDIVLIHDGARPFVTQQIIIEGIDSAVEFGASVPGVTPIDTQKEIDETGMIVRHLQRSKLTSVQTPQCFTFKKIYDAHIRAIEDKIEYTDDTEIWGNYCGGVKVFKGSSENIKITYPEDLNRLN